MQSSFFGLNVAVRGLFSAQRNLDVVNHNLNNVNTPGFSRQQTSQIASTPMALLDGTGMMGTGSEVVAVNRVRDEYLDFKYWSENIAYGEWQTKKKLLGDMEVTFNEPSDSGFNKITDEFYEVLQELSKDPSSLAVRAVVREKGVTFAKYFNGLASHFEKLQADVNYNINAKVEEINSIGSQIENLNKQIYITELDGNAANDLRDQRTVLVDKLSQMINIDANEIVTGKLPDGRDDKHFVITISGKAFVDHFNFRSDKSNVSKLTVRQRTGKLNDEDIDNLYEVQWEDGNKVDIRGGELKGYLDVRDGNDGKAPGSTYTGLLTQSPLYKGIPFYIKKLNEFVRVFAMSFNEGYIDTNGDQVIDASEDGPGHADGYSLNSADGDPASGIRFFTMLGADGKPQSSETFINGADTITNIADRYKNITAKNFAVSSDILGDGNLISTSDKAGQKGNTELVNALMKMRNNVHMFSEGAPEDFMKSLASTVGIDSQQSVRLLSNQETIVKQIDNRRISISGVSVDEEMANLVKYQNAYNATAHMISTLQEVYDTLVNRLGVG